MDCIQTLEVSFQICWQAAEGLRAARSEQALDDGNAAPAQEQQRSEASGTAASGGTAGWGPGGNGSAAEAGSSGLQGGPGGSGGDEAAAGVDQRQYLDEYQESFPSCFNEAGLEGA